MRGAKEADTAQGLFETLLVAGERAVELEAHLRRLGASCELLFDTPLPEGAAALARQHAAGIDLGRLRLTVKAGSAGLQVEAQASPVDPSIVFPAPEPGVELRTLRLPGGLGAHKWVDRPALESIRDPAVALLLDHDGTVLEASRANIFTVREGAIATSPADGRILPGIAREGTIEVAREEGIEAREEPLGLEDLLEADEVFLTGSVRGIQRADSLDGAKLPAAGALIRRLAAGLRRRWGLDAGAAGPTPAVAPRPGPHAR